MWAAIVARSIPWKRYTCLAPDAESDHRPLPCRAPSSYLLRRYCSLLDRDQHSLSSSIPLTMLPWWGSTRQSVVCLCGFEQRRAPHKRRCHILDILWALLHLLQISLSDIKAANIAHILLWTYTAFESRLFRVAVTCPCLWARSTPVFVCSFIVCIGCPIEAVLIMYVRLQPALINDADQSKRVRCIFPSFILFRFCNFRRGMPSLSRRCLATQHTLGPGCSGGDFRFFLYNWKKSTSLVGCSFSLMIGRTRFPLLLSFPHPGLSASSVVFAVGYGYTLSFVGLELV